MKAGYRDRITEDPDEKESEEFHMSHTREEEWKQVRALHLVRDERDREVGAAAKGRAGMRCWLPPSCLRRPVS